MAAVAAALAAGGCGGGEDSAGEPVASKETIVALVAEFGDRSSLWGEVKYEVEAVGGVRQSEFEVEVLNATPGDVYPVALDGVPLGELTIGIDGEGELEFSDEAGETPFPDDFAKPQPGSVFTVGPFEGTLAPEAGG